MKQILSKTFNRDILKRLAFGMGNTGVREKERQVAEKVVQLEYYCKLF